MSEAGHITRLNAALEGRYRVERQLGEGGMATVYLAADVRHGREVALKVLKPQLAAMLGADRFLAEIKTTAGLHHPHILPLLDSGTADGFLFYAMPYAEGESLRGRLDRERQLPVGEAVSIATDVAEALDYAHRRGFVHRDIKPANILMLDGRSVVADFGVALALRGTDAERLTQTGLSIGTPHYMSPEQATGDQPVDSRSDVFALGCVLYEMLVGEPPHRGKSIQAIVADIVSGEVPRPTKARPSVPAHVDAAVHCALERVPADRFDTCADFAAALADPSFRHGVGPLETTARSLRRWRATAVAATAVLLLVGAWGLVRSGPVRPTPAVPIRFSVPFTQPEGYAVGRASLAFAPDGAHVAFVDGGVGSDRLRLRALDELESWVVPSSVNALDPFFSPDGLNVGYATVDGLFTAAVSGGPPRRIVAFAEPRGVDWSRDGWIYFGSYSGLWRVRPDGSELSQITELRSDRDESIHSRPSVVLEAGLILFTIGHGSVDEFELATYRMGDGRIDVLGQGISPTYTEAGLLYGRSDGSLVLAPFDARRPVLSDPGEPVVQGIVAKPGALEYRVTRDGSLVYLRGPAAQDVLLMVDRAGIPSLLTASVDVYNSPRFSSDGRRLAVGVGTPPLRQVWILELAQEPHLMAPLTYEGHNYYGVWTPDDGSMLFARESGTRVDIFGRASDGSGDDEIILGDGAMNYPEEVSPDGRTLLVRVQDQGTGLHDIYAIDLGTDPVKRPLLNQPANEESPVVSPDGRWLAYASDISGRLEVYLTDARAPGARRQVSVGGGQEPVWSPGGDELFYWRADTLVAASVDPGGPDLVRGRTDLFAGEYRRWPFHANYDVHPDGNHFVVVEGRDSANQEIVVVVDWLASLRGQR